MCSTYHDPIINLINSRLAFLCSFLETFVYTFLSIFFKYLLTVQNQQYFFLLGCRHKFYNSTEGHQIKCSVFIVLSGRVLHSLHVKNIPHNNSRVCTSCTNKFSLRQYVLVTCPLFPPVAVKFTTVNSRNSFYRTCLIDLLLNLSSF